MLGIKFISNFQLLKLYSSSSNIHYYCLPVRIHSKFQRSGTLTFHELQCLRSYWSARMMDKVLRNLLRNKVYFPYVLYFQTSKFTCNVDFVEKSNGNLLCVNNLISVTDVDLKKSLSILQSHNVAENDIKRHIKLLDDHQSYAKVLCLVQISSNVADILPLLVLPLNTLKQAAKQASIYKNNIPKFQDRISYLCHHLELSVADLLQLVVKHTILLTLNFERLNTKMEILKSANISAESLAKDLWIFNYNEKLLLDRVTVAKKAGVSLKPWLLRCSKKYFHQFVANWKETQNVLAGDDQITYLSKKLNCSKAYVLYLMKRNTTLHSVNAIKLEKILQFLFKKGYTSEEICMFPKVFCSNIETLKKRFEIFYEKKEIMPTLPQLSMTNVFNRSLKNCQGSSSSRL